jgi:hypothetical protein
MSTTEIPLAEISARAREVRFRRSLVMLFVGIFFAIGWTAGRIWYGAAFSATAVRIGYRQGAMKPPKPAPQQQ